MASVLFLRSHFFLTHLVVVTGSENVVTGSESVVTGSESVVTGNNTLATR